MSRPSAADYDSGYSAARRHGPCMDDTRILATMGRWQIHRSRYSRAKQFEFASGLLDGYADVMRERMGNVQWGVRA